MRRTSLWRIISLLALTSLLAACSTLKFAYDQSPQLLYWWLDGYLDFSSTQAPQVRDELAKLQQWHRRTQLLPYADTLQKLQQLMPETLTAEQVCSVYEGLRNSLQAVAEQAEPAVVSLAMGLDPEQIRHLEAKYAKNNTAWRKDWISASPQAQADKHLDNIQERLEMLYGRLTSAQKDWLRGAIADARLDSQPTYTERLRRQQDALATLQKIATDKPPQAQVRVLMQGYLARSLNSPDPAYRSYQSRLTQEGCAGFAQLHNGTSAAQRETAVKKLQGYERDLRELAASR